MQSLNRIQLIGHVGSEPKLIKGKKGKEFLAVSLATNDSYMRDNEVIKRTTWHNLLLFGILSSNKFYLKKGCYVFVEGKLQISQWQDNQGSKRQTANIIVDYIRWLANPNQQSDSPDIAVQNLSEMQNILEVADVEGND